MSDFDQLLPVYGNLDKLLQGNVKRKLRGFVLSLFMGTQIFYFVGEVDKSIRNGVRFILLTPCVSVDITKLDIYSKMFFSASILTNRFSTSSSTKP